MKWKLWSGLAGISLNIIILAGITVMSQIASIRHSSGRLAAELRRELEHYRIILLAPTLPPPEPKGTQQSTVARGARNNPRPLAVPDPRLLQALAPGLVDFVGENPAIESIVTREIVRDVDSKTLDVKKLLEKSGMQISFGVDESGQILWCKVDKSSHVPSIDHLALELVRLLEKYQLLAIITGVERVVASIQVDQQMDISLEGNARPGTPIGSMRNQIEAGLTLWRLLLDQSDAASLQGISIVTQENRIRISKSFDKESIVTLLMRYYQPGAAK